MSTPFLLQFSYHIVRALVVAGKLELDAQHEQAVIEHLAASLGRVETGSLVSELSRALLTSPHVVELYADDTTIKEMISELGQ